MQKFNCTKQVKVFECHYLYMLWMKIRYLINYIVKHLVLYKWYLIMYNWRQDRCHRLFYMSMQSVFVVLSDTRVHLFIHYFLSFWPICIERWGHHFLSKHKQCLKLVSGKTRHNLKNFEFHACVAKIQVHTCNKLQQQGY